MSRIASPQRCSCERAILATRVASDAGRRPLECKVDRTISSDRTTRKIPHQAHSIGPRPPAPPARSLASRPEKRAIRLTIGARQGRFAMTRQIRPASLLTAMVLGLSVFATGHPAQAQRNTYEDFPYNQGTSFLSLPPPKPKTRTVYRPVVSPQPASAPVGLQLQPALRSRSSTPLLLQPPDSLLLLLPHAPIQTRVVPEAVPR